MASSVRCADVIPLLLHPFIPSIEPAPVKKVKKIVGHVMEWTGLDAREVKIAPAKTVSAELKGNVVPLHKVGDGKAKELVPVPATDTIQGGSAAPPPPPPPLASGISLRHRHLNMHKCSVVREGMSSKVFHFSNVLVYWACALCRVCTVLTFTILQLLRAKTQHLSLHQWQWQLLPSWRSMLLLQRR